jgi:hypothetical protein
MTTFVLTGNYLFEEVDGRQCVSVYCLVKGGVRFSRISSSTKRGKIPRNDESGMRLLQQIRHLNAVYSLMHPESIDADIVKDNVIVVHFQVSEMYNRDIVTHLYDIIYGYCLIEEALGTPRALETFNDLSEQTRSLLLQLGSMKKNEEHVAHLPYLANSIRYGALDVFGGVISSAPKNYKRATLMAWLMPIRKRIIDQRKLQIDSYCL